MGPAQKETAGVSVESLAARFGLRWVDHRIGARALRFAEVRDVDRCVAALYPQCLVDHGDAPVWMISWPAAFGLAEYLVHEGDLTRGSLLELGCGTAVVGVTAAAAGARVHVTDYDEVALCVARENARENGVQLRATRLDWYAPDLGERYPLVVGSEITYHEVAFAPLLDVMDQATSPGGTVVLSDIYRRQTDGFLRLAEQRGWGATLHDRVVHLAAQSHRVRIMVFGRRARATAR